MGAWRGVAFPNGETDLVREPKLEVSDDLRLVEPANRGPVFGGNSAVALHIAKVPATSIGQWKPPYQYSHPDRLSSLPAHTMVSCWRWLGMAQINPLSHGSLRFPLLRRPFVTIATHRLRTDYND
jgi:hypothetical protein